MSGLPEQASVVVIGAGIVGNSMAYHLARLGWRDVVLLDKGPLPSPGGSTGHASNFIYLVDHSKEMTRFTVESVAQYKELGVFTESGGIEVARTPERMEELKRRIASAKSWGVEPVELLTPGEVRKLVPFINQDVVLGGFHTPGVGVVDSLQAGTLMRQRAQEIGALTVSASTQLVGIDVENGRVARVRTDRGDIRHGHDRDRLRRVESQDRAHGRSLDPTHSRRPPDDRRRSRPHLRADPRRDRLPHRPRHGHEHVRAAERRRLRDRLLRASADPDGAGRHPVDRGGGDVAHRAAVHPGRLRPADGGRARAVSGDPPGRAGGRPPRDQRAPLAHTRWDADPRRVARGEGPVVGRRDLDQGGAGDRQDRRGVDDRRPPRDRPAPVGHRPVLRTSAIQGARPGADRRGLQQDLRHRAPRRAVGVEPSRAGGAVLRPSRRPRRRIRRGRRVRAT